MVKSVYVNDTNYGCEEVKEHRKLIIELRDAALKSNHFDWAVTLSVTVALLSHFAEMLDKPLTEKEQGLEV